MKSTCIYLSIAFFLILTSSCFYTKDIQIIKTANDRYYNLAKNGLRSFNCKIEVKEINELFDLTESEHFLATVIAGGHIDLETLLYFDHKVKKFGKELKLTLDGAENIISGTLGMWGGFTFDPLFPESESIYKVSTRKNYYFIEEINNSERMITKLNKKLKLVEFVSEENGQKILIVKTDFIKTEKGYLLQNFSMRLHEVNYENDIRINYLEIDGFLLPKNFIISNIVDGKHHKITLIFSDYQLEKEK